MKKQSFRKGLIMLLSASFVLGSCENYNDTAFQGKTLTYNERLVDIISEEKDDRFRKVYSSKGVLLVLEYFDQHSSSVITNCDGASFGEHLYIHHFKPFFSNPCDFYKELPSTGAEPKSQLLQSLIGEDFVSSLSIRDWECMRDYCRNIGCGE